LNGAALCDLIEVDILKNQITGAALCDLVEDDL